MSTGRLESFSDGVIAVAITLLVLTLVVPDSCALDPRRGCHSLGHDLVHMWPQYAAYGTSFITVGIIWINHHVAVGRLARADHTVMFLNLLLLMSVVLLPFATNLMATYLREPRGQHLAAAIYGGSLLFMGVLFAVLNSHILSAKAQLLKQPLPAAVRRRILVRSVGGITPYAVATVLAAVSAYATLLICAAVAVFYALPVGSGSDVLVTTE